QNSQSRHTRPQNRAAQQLTPPPTPLHYALQNRQSRHTPPKTPGPSSLHASAPLHHALQNRQSRHTPAPKRPTPAAYLSSIFRRLGWNYYHFSESETAFENLLFPLTLWR